MQRRSGVVVVGAGIAGLTAAYDLAGLGFQVLVLEAAARPGGKLAVSEVGGLAVDAGAEAVLARVPDAVELMHAVGLGADIVVPATANASIAVDGELYPVPAGTVLGVPADLNALAQSGLLSPAGLAAVAADLDRPSTPITADRSVAAALRPRIGDEILDRLVEPLLGGVYAGRTESLSLLATMPALAAALRSDGSVLRAARTIRAGTPALDGPVFASLRGGLTRLITALAATPGVVVRTGVTVRDIGRDGGGFRLVTGPASRPQWHRADAVVVATPGGKAAGLLAGLAPDAAVDLAAVEYAGTAIVTLAVPRQSLPGGSGLLVPPGAGVVKAVTLSSQKWAHLDVGEQVVLRASVGRRGETAVLQRGDAELTALVLADLRRLLGLRGEPIQVRVTRWGGALPQYDVGHLDRVARIRAAVAAVPGLAVCGALYDGVGVPACIRSARTAVAAL